MKKAIIILMVIIALKGYSQNAPITTISSANACNYSLIRLKISQTNVQPFSSLRLRLEYDATVLSFVKPNPNYIYTNSALYTNGGNIIVVQDSVSGNPSLKQLTLNWSALSGTVIPTIINGGDILCNLTFRYYGGNTTLVWNNSASGGQECEYINSTGNPFIDNPSSNFYINGNIYDRILSINVDTIIGFTNPCIGSTTSFSVLSSGATSFSWIAPTGWSGNSIIDSITYTAGNSSGYVYAKGTNIYGCSDVAYIYVKPGNSVPAFTLSAIPDTIVNGSSSSLILYGGYSGAGGIWKWFTSSCGGTLIATGNTLIVSPTAITTYYVRAEGNCNTTLCKTITVSLYQQTPVTYLSSDTACIGDTVKLHFTQTNVKAISGFGLRLDYDAAVLSFINPNPNSLPGNFYNTNSALYLQGGDITGVQNTVTGNTSLKQLIIYWTASIGAATPNTVGNTAAICELSFRYYGGSTSIVWNNSSGGGQYCEYSDVLGNPYNDNPSSAFYKNGFITNYVFQTNSGVITGNIYPCTGSIATYSVAYSAGVTYTWTVPSGWIGNSTSNSITLTTGSTTDYLYLTSSNSCGVNKPSVLRIYSSSFSTAPTNLVAVPDSLYPGYSTALYAPETLGSNAKWKWFLTSCGGTLIGSGSGFIVSPSIVTTYFSRAEGQCNTTSCESITICFHNHIDHSPIAVNDTIYVTPNVSEFIIHPLQNDYDVDGDLFKISYIITNPKHGNMGKNDTIIFYNPINPYTGLDSIQYSIYQYGSPNIRDTAWIILHVSNATIYNYIDTNNIRALVNPTNSIFCNRTYGYGIPSYEFPKGSGKCTIYANSLWIGGIDSVSGNLHLAGTTFSDYSNNFCTGPLTTNGTTYINSATTQFWNRTWKINKCTIDSFKLWYANNSIYTNYIIPAIITSWPSNGATGQSSTIAPYVDFNGDGNYNPNNGDYPLIKGHQAIFYVINDATTHTNGGLPLGVEIRVMVYAFDTIGPLDNPRLRNRIF